MYHMKKKFTRKVQRSTGIVNKKKNNRKRVTKKVKLSKKNLNKKNKRRRRIVKKGGSDHEPPGPESITGGYSYNKQMGGQNEGPKMGGSSCGAHDNNGLMGGSSCDADSEQMGGENHEDPAEMPPISGGSNCGSRSKGGAHDLTDTFGGSYNKAQKGGNSCGCGV